MDEHTRNKIGSSFEDAMRHARKQWPNSNRFFGLNIDYVVIEKYPVAGIVCGYDFKRNGGKLTWAEGVGYDDWVQHYPLFLVFAMNPYQGPYTVFQYLHSTNLLPEPIEYDAREIATFETPVEFQNFEAELRQEYRRRHRPLSPQEGERRTVG